MKLWQKGIDTDAAIEQFTVGRDRELDLQLAPYDILGSLAHVSMLESIGLLEADELEALKKALRHLYHEARAGRFAIEEGVEDVHSQVEKMLTEQLGEIGKKMHAGRSRNDQVLVDLRLFFRAELADIARALRALFEQLLSLSSTHRDVMLPGYTHLQVAMPSSFGLWFGAWAETLVDDLRLLEAVYHIVNQNPLGSAAGYGSSFPLDRRQTTRLLGFEDLAYNVVHAQLGRGKTEQFLAFGLAGLGATLSRLGMDLVLYLSQNFAFIRFPDELTTGSSIMPHKKNPDVFELIRGKANQLLGLPAQVSLLCASLPSGYHRDFQLLKEVVFPALANARDCLDMLTYALGHIEVQEDILEDPKYRYLFSVEAVNQAVLKGTPFREAYRQVAEQLQNEEVNLPREVAHTHEGSIGNLALDEIRRKMESVWNGFHFTEAEGAIEALVGGKS